MAGTRGTKKQGASNATVKAKQRRYTPQENLNYLQAIGVRLQKGADSAASTLSRLANRFRRAEREGRRISRKEARGHGGGEYHRGRALHLGARHGRTRRGTVYGVPEQWVAGPHVRKRTSKARWAGPDDVLQALHHIKGANVRVAILGYWLYTRGGTGEFAWKSVVMPKGQLENELRRVREELASYEEVQIVAAGGDPTKAERKEIAAYVVQMERTLMLELVNETLFDGDPIAESAFAWSLAESRG